MVNIVKDGKREFTGYCCRCGCEFTYELSDIVVDLYVICPFCQTPKAWKHPNQATLHTAPSVNYNNSATTTTVKNGELDFWKSQPTTADNPFFVTVDTGNCKPL